MKRLFLFCLYISFYLPTLAQQFSFKELLLMTSSRSKFESLMIKIGNYPKSLSSYSIYESRYQIDSVITVNLEEHFKYDSTMKDIIKITYDYSKFVQNYDTEDETGTTFYTYTSKKTKNVKGGIPRWTGKDNISLKVEYIQSSDYTNILKEITSISRYIETKDISNKIGYPEYVSTYKLDTFLINIIKSEERNRGGIIEIIKFL